MNPGAFDIVEFELDVGGHPTASQFPSHIVRGEL